METTLTRQDKAHILDLVNAIEPIHSFIDQNHITIKSMSKKGHYVITLDNSGLAISCTCPDHVYRLKECKHIIYVNNLIS